MKGILESVPQFFYIVIAIVVALLLFGMLFQFFGQFKKSEEISISGNKDDVAKKITTYIQECWRDNREGLNPNSDVCRIIDMNSTEIVKEYDVTKHLDCKLIPNDRCDPDDCSSCKSPDYPEQDKLIWDVQDKEGKIKISYSGSDRRIEVVQI